MNDELVKQVLSNDTAETDDDRMSIESAVVMCVLVNIVAAGIWLGIGSLSGWETTGVFGISATEATVGAGVLSVGSVALWLLPASDEGKRTVFAFIALVGFALFAFGAVVGTGILAEALGGNL